MLNMSKGLFLVTRYFMRLVCILKEYIQDTSRFSLPIAVHPTVDRVPTTLEIVSNILSSRIRAG